MEDSIDYVVAGAGEVDCGAVDADALDGGCDAAVGAMMDADCSMSEEVERDWSQSGPSWVGPWWTCGNSCQRRWSLIRAKIRLTEMAQDRYLVLRGVHTAVE